MDPTRASTTGASGGARAAAAGSPASSLSDRYRRQLGRALDRAGMATAPSPWTPRLEHPLFELRDYGGDAPAALLIVPAPIKSPAIWDLAPESSVVRHCLRAGIRTSLIAWKPADPARPQRGLADYVNAIADAARALPGPPPVVAGHSLGGTLAALYASLAPQRAAGLVLLEAPLSFGTGVGVLDALMSALPSARALTAGRASVAGSELGLAAMAATPDAFLGERWLDWLHSLSDPRALALHLRVTRWTLDELPMPRQLFVDVMDQLYRGDRFAQGSLRLAGHRAALEALTLPTLVVADPLSRVVPLRSALPRALAARGATLLRYQREHGVCLQHVGPLVGRRALRELWPRITAWVHERGAGEQ